MSGKKIGYIRVRSFDQNPERQLDGIKIDKKFIDKALGKDVKCSALAKLLNYIREDDPIIINSMDRLARNLDDLRQIVKKLTEQSIKIQFLKENLIFTGEDSPMSNLLLSVMGTFAEFERSLIRERQKEGIALARAKELFKGCAPSLKSEQIALGVPKSKLARDYN